MSSKERLSRSPRIKNKLDKEQLSDLPTATTPNTMPVANKANSAAEAAFNVNGPDDADIAGTWRALQSVQIKPESLTCAVTTECTKLLNQGNVYELEKLFHFFPETETLVQQSEALHERSVALIRKEIASGNTESAVEIMDLLKMKEPLPLSEAEARELATTEITMSDTADGSRERLARLGVSTEIIVREASEAISRLVPHDNNHVLAAINPNRITNIICLVPELEADASKAISSFLQNTARESVRQGIWNPLIDYVKFFEGGSYPLDPSPYTYITASDIEAGIQYLLGHHDVQDFRALGMAVERNSSWDLYTVFSLLEHIPLSPEFRSNPEILKALKQEFIRGFTAEEGHVTQGHEVRRLLPHFDFSESDLQEIIRTAGDEWTWSDPAVVDEAVKDMEMTNEEFNKEVPQFMPWAREVIRTHKDIAWIVRKEICQYYFAPRLTEGLCEQMRRDFPKSLNISAPQVKALAIAWYEQTQPRLENPQQNTNLLNTH